MWSYLLERRSFKSKFCDISVENTDYIFRCNTFILYTSYYSFVVLNIFNAQKVCERFVFYYFILASTNMQTVINRYIKTTHM